MNHHDRMLRLAHAEADQAGVRGDMVVSLIAGGRVSVDHIYDWAAIEGGVATAGSLSVRVDTACCYVPIAESASGVATTSPAPPMHVDRDGRLLALGAVKPDGDVGIVQIDALGHVRLSDEDITRIGHEVARVLKAGSR